MLYGCGKNAPVISQQDVKVTPQVLREIGLPIYPGARPSGREPAVRQRFTTGYGGTNALVVVLETPDDFDRVVAFYAGQLPATSRKFAFHNFGVGSAEFEFWVKDGQRQVTLTSIQGTTLIVLQATKLTVPAPRASASASASAQAR